MEDARLKLYIVSTVASVSTLLFAGIVWLIQLNVGYSILKEQSGRHEILIEQQRLINVEQTSQLSRISAILESIEHRVGKNEDFRNR